jgi:hypothetical protein
MSLQSAYLQLMNKWAGRLGSPFDQYRPTTNACPLLDSPIGTVTAIFDASISLAFNAPAKYADPLFAAIVDPRVVDPGDYLVSAAIGTWFVASTEPLKPILAVSCNRTISIQRPSAPNPGRDFYGGATPPDDEPLMTDFPASVLIGTKGEKTTNGLPGDTRDPWWQILIPSPPDVVIRAFDLISDDVDRHFVVSAAEQTSLGWRLTVSLAET